MKTLSIKELENAQGGMPCWAAKALLVAAGVSFTFLTGGLGSLAFGLIGVLGSGWGYIESCFPELMES